MVQKYEAYIKSRAKKQRAVMLDPGAALRAGYDEMMSVVKKPKKKKVKKN